MLPAGSSNEVRRDKIESGRCCRRCAANRLQHDHDAGYRRVNKTRKIERLRATTGGHGAPGTSSARGSFLHHRHSRLCQPKPTVSVDSAVKRLSLPSHRPSSSSVPLSLGQTATTLTLDRAVGNMVISAVEANRLFIKFFREYHPFIDFLDPASSPDGTYVQSPLLFWAVIAVASRRDCRLQATLGPLVTDLLWTKFARPPCSLADVQGMLLTCFWPFPAASISLDCRSALIAATTSVAMQIGLNCAESMQDSCVNQNAPLVGNLKAAKTWAACIVAAKSVFGFASQLAAAQDDMSCRCKSSVSSQGSLPLQLDYLLQIFKFCNRVHNFMAPLDQVTGNQGIAKLVVLETKVRVMLLFAGLQLRLHYFFEPRKSFHHRRGMILAYQLTLLLADQLKIVDEPGGLLRSAPVIYQDAMIFACFLLLKVTKSDDYNGEIDVAAGKTALRVCLTKLRNCVAETDDFRAKVYELFERLRRNDHELRSGATREPNAKLRPRFSGSLIHDFLWMWRKELGDWTSAGASQGER
ncbi:hypothetical protein M409DRAFT_60024 [Zasmidium cellare ATCC 36951]|uniref:Transcription factor domain-containing protein n=1 Tax=Zasmidium cellare ATCC 36951 TaxID=1080233 RepID=A0A6A6C374_ZASCE|nr:uncharacterized protein M409DRAFT_60024 [Zasmidium cellare ATCC 36951]KAF2160322.1 hypothetical protein M409DRAFT_60024 [Zasmidium cellare ATCC 36951]